MMVLARKIEGQCPAMNVEGKAERAVWNRRGRLDDASFRLVVSCPFAFCHSHDTDEPATRQRPRSRPEEGGDRRMNRGSLGSNLNGGV
jgi:hypothetical protein